MNSIIKQDFKLAINAARLGKMAAALSLFNQCLKNGADPEIIRDACITFGVF